MRARSAKGFALIDLIFVCGIIGVLCSVALPRLLLARQTAGAAAAIGSMRAINSAELTYALTCGSGFYAPNLSTLGRPPVGSNEPYINGGLGDADLVTKSGYIVQIIGTPYAGAPITCNDLPAGEGAQGFKAVADPSEPNNTRFFATNSNATIYEHYATLLVDMPEVGDPVSGHPLR